LQENTAIHFEAIHVPAAAVKETLGLLFERPYNDTTRHARGKVMFTQDHAAARPDRNADTKRQSPSVGAGRSIGRPLDGKVLAPMERAFGHNFANVRVHTDETAASMSRQMHARAFTHGSDIYFGAGQYDPGRVAGKYILAHELAHVVQQQPALQPKPARRRIEDDANSAALDVLRGIQPSIRENHDGSEVHCIGEPESVPDFTFVARAEPNDNGFIQQAFDYHRDWGFNPRSAETMDEVVTNLSGATGHINRLRLVSHANVDNIFMRLFTGSTRGIAQEQLAGFGFSDAAGTETTLQGSSANSFLFSDQTTAVLAALHTANSPALGPVGLTAATSSPSADLTEFIRRSADILFIGIGTVQVQPDTGNARAATAAEKTQLRTSEQTLLSSVQSRIVQSTASAASPITDQNLQDLQAAIGGLTLAALSLQSAGTVTVPEQTVRNLTAANRAIAGGFRGRLDTVKGRFDSSSFVDIRGCRLGQNPDYMRAVQCYFGRSGNLPEVSAPEWFQSFPSFGFQGLADEAGVDASAASGVSSMNVTGADVTTAIGLWGGLSGATAQLAFWTQLFGGGPVPFVSFSWRSSVPALTMASEIDSVTTAGFGDVLRLLQRIFNVAAATLPTAQQITDLDQKRPLAASLGQIQSGISAALGAATPDPSRLQALQQQLSQLEQQVSPAPATTGPTATTAATATAATATATAATATTPSTATTATAGAATAITAAQLQTRATALQQTLAGQVAPINAFMQAVAAKLTNANALLRFYFNLGFVLPVQSTAVVDSINLLVMNTLRNRAIERWLRVQWLGTVPANAAVLSPPVDIAAVRSRRYAALSDAHQATQVVFTPTPAYMSHIIRLNGGNFTCNAQGSTATVRAPSAPANPAATGNPTAGGANP
jgi:hypothetical protein